MGGFRAGTHLSFAAMRNLPVKDDSIIPRLIE